MIISSFRNNSSLLVVLLSTFVVFCTLYAPQPLLPLFSSLFQVSATQTALLITVTFLFLCVTPLAVGVLLNHFTAKRLLIFATALLGILHFAFSHATTFQGLLSIRTLQSILYPILFTAAVTYCSKAGEDSGRGTRIGLYIATTITGGLAGRLLSGFLTSVYNWSFSFQVLGVALLVSAAALSLVKQDITKQSDQSSRKLAAQILHIPGFVPGLALIFTTFFSFSATLNALPFRMVAIEPDISPSRISLVYIGYIVCIFIAAYTQKISHLLGGTRSAMRLALTVFMAGLVLMSYKNINWLILVGFLTAGGAFLIHASLNGYLVNLSPDNAGLVNGLYISTYYLAGALGSVVPLWIYKQTHWHVFLLCLFVVSAIGYLSLRKINTNAVSLD